MPLAMAIPLFVLIGLGVGCAVYYGVLGARVAGVIRGLPTLASAVGRAGAVDFWPRLCVVVPAHNEEGVIGTLVRSLKRQDYPNLRVVLALDRCTDGTEAEALAAIEEDDGTRESDRAWGGSAPAFEIVRVESCPEDWAGKVHAAHSGVVRGEGVREAELLLFTDADTWYEPAALRAAVHLHRERYLDLLSLLPTLSAGRWFERLVQPAAGFELMRRYPLDRLNRDGRVRFANGQFMLFRRDSYEKLGGHEAVKDALLEDLAFAKLVARRKSKMKLGVLLSGGLFRCRMYGSWAEFRRGWKRIYTESAHRYVSRLRRDAWRVRLLGAVLPLLAVAGVVAGVVVWGVAQDGPLALALGLGGGVGVLMFVVAMFLMHRIQGLGVVSMAAYPVGAWATGSILLEAARDLERGRATEWGGRSYVREAK